MKKLVFLLIFVAISAQGQYKIKGELQSSEKITWILLYKIEGAKQVFVKNVAPKTVTKLEKGVPTTIKHFEFVLPENAPVGSYRIIYRNDGTGFVDVLFNKEDISFSYDSKNPEESLIFSKSKENILYQNYVNLISVLQHKTDSLQVAYLKNPSVLTAKHYTTQLKKIARLRNKYAKESTGKLAKNFIISANKYNSPQIEKTPEAYLNSLKTHYFDAINLNDKVLYNSAFLLDRITDYVFYLNYSEDAETQKKLYQEAVTIVIDKINNITFKEEVLEYLITQFINQKEIDFVDYLLDTVYSKLPSEIQNVDFKKNVLEKIAVEIGRIAPEIIWTENGKKYKLSTLNEAKNYVLVFWSTACSHCLREIPQLNSFTLEKQHVKVIAFSLEDDAENWKNYKKSLLGWHHVLGLKKWENPIARTYQIFSTPTYIVLDSNKKIIAKPETLEELKKIINYLD